MISFTDSPDIPPPSPDLPDPFPQVPDRKNEPGNKGSALPGESCLRCGGLLIPDYTTSMERGERDKPVMLRRCVNCGSCMDLDILANRSKRPIPTRPPPDARDLRQGRHGTNSSAEWEQAWLSKWSIILAAGEYKRLRSRCIAGEAGSNRIYTAHYLFPG